MKLFRLFLVLLFISSCSAFDNIGSSTTKKEKAEPGLFSKDSKAGINLGDLLFKKENDGTNFYVNAFLWRGSLEVMSIAPLISTDAFGGTILSDWFQDPKIKNKRIKITIFVKSRELRSDGISVKVLVQNKKGQFWSEITEDKNLSSKLEEIILAKARELRMQNSQK